jgi:hypothetical protein
MLLFNISEPSVVVAGAADTWPTFCLRCFLCFRGEEISRMPMTRMRYRARQVESCIHGSLKLVSGDAHPHIGFYTNSKPRITQVEPWVLSLCAKPTKARLWPNLDCLCESAFSFPSFPNIKGLWQTKNKSGFHMVTRIVCVTALI